MRQCLKDGESKVCRCVFDGDKLNIDAYKLHENHLGHLRFMLSYEKLDPEENRSLCRVAICEKCGELYCESIGRISERVGGDDTIEEIFNIFARQISTLQPELILTQPSPRDVFIGLFDDKDKGTVNNWVNKKISRPDAGESTGGTQNV